MAVDPSKLSMAFDPSKLQTQIDIKPPPPPFFTESVPKPSKNPSSPSSPLATVVLAAVELTRGSYRSLLFFIFVAFMATMVVNDCWSKSHGDCVLKALGGCRFSRSPRTHSSALRLPRELLLLLF
ncbi:hypothetical protein Pyn_20664 [Prunus yedoensis var. nudiflora]|uniref:Uncharacterized protein n=1 Tax=Prunus yedoensis var. nudiflora TaxID=2094558 RepID=A0A314UVH9_PRUYE|nr:hypothetical protein Pyn_20664 [Prunus yedoensis var. nudiflora]